MPETLQMRPFVGVLKRRSGSQPKDITDGVTEVLPADPIFLMLCFGPPFNWKCEEVLIECEL